MSKKPYRINREDVVVKAENALYTNNGMAGVADAKGALDNLQGRVASLEQGGTPTATGKVSVKLLCIGNSLLQDCVAYLPLVLNEFRDYIDYKIYLWYCGGHSLTQNYNRFVNGQTAEIFSICENGVTWTNHSNDTTMATILNTYEFDTLVLQEFFDSMSGGTDPASYTDAAKASYENIVNWIKARYDGDFSVYSYWETPYRGNGTFGNFSRENTLQRLSMAEECLEWQLLNTSCEGIIPSGIAAARAIDVAQLNTLGTAGCMSADGVHSQEGLPCLMLAWVFGQWLMDKLGLPYDEAFSQVRITQSIVSTLNVPGGNGTRIDGTEAQAIAARDVARQAAIEGKYIVNTMLNE